MKITHDQGHILVRAFVFVLFGIFLIMFMSCEQERTCTCTVNVGGSISRTSITQDMKKKDCKSDSHTVTNGILITTSCRLD